MCLSLAEAAEEGRRTKAETLHSLVCASFPRSLTRESVFAFDYRHSSTCVAELCNQTQPFFQGPLCSVGEVEMLLCAADIDALTVLPVLCKAGSPEL